MSAPIRLHDRPRSRSQRPRFAICTLGCKLNQADESDLRRELRQAGLVEVSFSDVADVYIVNTCTVTHLADRRSRQMLRRARRKNAEALVAAIGCYPQVAPEDLRAMPEVDLIVDSIDKLTVVDEILENVGQIHEAFDSDGTIFAGDRTRRMIKIQEGCRAHCTYCVIPKARGGPRNWAPDDVISQVQAAEAEGFREVVLTGTHVGTYKWKTDGSEVARLADLLEDVLEHTSIPRIRITSVGPHEIDARFIEILRNPRVMPHLHMALQSGSSAVLKRMKRWYNLQQFRRSVGFLRDAIPAIGLTTDVIVGFPGETEEEFEETLSFVEEIGFSDVHVFPFSARRGTLAAEMPNSIDPQTRERRARALRELGQDLSRRFAKQLVGSVATVLVEDRPANLESGEDLCSGLTGNYVRAYASSFSDNPSNQIMTAEIVAPFRDGVRLGPPFAIE
jgi:threonylcarbamoyladenosine tRNA methylthiotransferase MtaB